MASWQPSYNCKFTSHSLNPNLACFNLNHSWKQRKGSVSSCQTYHSESDESHGGRRARLTPRISFGGSSKSSSVKNGSILYGSQYSRNKKKMKSEKQKGNDECKSESNASISNLIVSSEDMSDSERESIIDNFMDKNTSLFVGNVDFSCDTLTELVQHCDSNDNSNNSNNSSIKPRVDTLKNRIIPSVIHMNRNIHQECEASTKLVRHAIDNGNVSDELAHPLSSISQRTQSLATSVARTSSTIIRLFAGGLVLEKMQNEINESNDKNEKEKEWKRWTKLLKSDHDCMVQDAIANFQNDLSQIQKDTTLLLNCINKSVISLNKLPQWNQALQRIDRLQTEMATLIEKSKQKQMSVSDVADKHKQISAKIHKNFLILLDLVHSGEVKVSPSVTLAIEHGVQQWSLAKKIGFAIAFIIGFPFVILGTIAAVITNH